MLAYVFWHWPVPELSAADYEEAQRAFHIAVAQSAPRGFLGSYVFRVSSPAPWLGATPAYADWYLVDTSAALDPLNEAAVTGICETPHAAVARAMDAGAGSLFTFRGDGRPYLDAVRHATFLTKPRSTPYPSFYSTLATAPEASTLWRRTMVLGPTPEFVLLTQTEPEVADDLRPLALILTRIYPAP